MQSWAVSVQSQGILYSTSKVDDRGYWSNSRDIKLNTKYKPCILGMWNHKMYNNLQEGYISVFPTPADLV